MKRELAISLCLLSACGGGTGTVAPVGDAPSPSPRTTPGPDSPTSPPARTAGGPGSQAAAPSVVMSAVAADRIDALLTGATGKAAVVVAVASSGQVLYSASPDELVFAASLYKLGVLLEAERRIEAGTLAVADRITITKADHVEYGSFTAAGTVLSIDDALERMIALSDNASALALIRTLGIASIQATLDREQIDLRFTAAGAVTTARAVATFFGELVRGSLVSRSASARMLGRLARQRSADRLPAALPEGAVIAHKTGNLGFATHDAGIIRASGGATLAIAVLTWDSDEGAAIELIKQIAAVVYEGAVRL